MAAHGIAVVDTPVGDRHVLAALEERRLALGGEQSGHIILRDRTHHRRRRCSPASRCST